MGTSITEAQLKLLARYTKRFVFALDPDVAGSEATIRALQMAEEVLDKEAEPTFDPRGFIRFEERLNAEIFILSLPPGQDPDDLIRESPDSWREALEKASPVAEFFLQLLSQKFDLSSPKGKAEAVRTLVPILRAIKDEVEREHYIYRLSRLVKVDEGVIRRELGALARTRPLPQRKAPRTILGLEEYALAKLMTNPPLLSFLDEKMAAMGFYPLNEADFTESNNRILFSLWKATLGRDGGRLEEFLESLDPLLRESASAILAKVEHSPPTPWEKVEDEILYCALRLREQSIRYYLQELRFLQEEAREQGDEESLSHYRSLIKAQAEELASIHRAMSRYHYRQREV
jgi:DNA primase